MIVNINDDSFRLILLINWSKSEWHAFKVSADERQSKNDKSLVLIFAILITETEGCWVICVVVVNIRIRAITQRIWVLAEIDITLWLIVGVRIGWVGIGCVGIGCVSIPLRCCVYVCICIYNVLSCWVGICRIIVDSICIGIDCFCCVCIGGCCINGFGNYFSRFCFGATIFTIFVFISISLGIVIAVGISISICVSVSVSVSSDWSWRNTCLRSHCCCASCQSCCILTCCCFSLINRLTVGILFRNRCCGWGRRYSNRCRWWRRLYWLDCNRFLWSFCYRLTNSHTSCFSIRIRWHCRLLAPLISRYSSWCIRWRWTTTWTWTWSTT